MLMVFGFFAGAKRFLIYICFFAAVVTYMAFAFPSSVFAAQDISVSIDGIEVMFSKNDGFGEPFMDRNSRVQTPVRKTLEALGGAVEYDASNRIVTVILNGEVLQFEIDGKTWLNSKLYEIDTSAMTIADRTYIPMRYAVEPFGYSVKWDAAKCNVLVRQAVKEVWTSPNEATLPMSMLTGSIGLVFSGSYGEIPDGEFYSYDRPHITLVNMADFNSGKDAVFEPIDFEYRLFRVSDKASELLYSKAFPQFSGTLPAGTFTDCMIELPFWNRENLTPGIYKIQLVFPEYFVYRLADSEVLCYLPIRPNMYNEIYEFTVKGLN
jgi:hypothetical protein